MRYEVEEARAMKSLLGVRPAPWRLLSLAVPDAEAAEARLWMVVKRRGRRHLRRVLVTDGDAVVRYVSIREKSVDVDVDEDVVGFCLKRDGGEKRRQCALSGRRSSTTRR